MGDPAGELLVGTGDVLPKVKRGMSVLQPPSRALATSRKMEEKPCNGCRLLPIASEVASSSRTVRSSREAKAASRSSSTVVLLFFTARSPGASPGCPARARPSRVRRGSRAVRERAGPSHRAAPRPSTRPERVKARQDTLRAAEAKADEEVRDGDRDWLRVFFTA